MTSRSKNLIVASIFAGTVAALAFVFSHRQLEPTPQFPGQDPTSIEVSVDFKLIGSIADTGDLMRILRTAKFVPPHPCAARGQFILRYPTRESVNVSIYPGHTPNSYEFAVGGTGYVISRAKLLSSLQAGGIDARKIPQ